MIGRHGAAFTGFSVALLPFDPWWLIFVPMGLFLGWLARAGRMIGESRPWPEIRRDIAVSLLIGGANGLLAALVIWRFELSYLPGLAVAFVCAFGGIQSLDTAVRWGWRHIASDAEAEGRKRQEAQIMMAENKAVDLDRMARKLTDGDDKDGLTP